MDGFVSNVTLLTSLPYRRFQGSLYFVPPQKRLLKQEYIPSSS